MVVLRILPLVTWYITATEGSPVPVGTLKSGVALRASVSLFELLSHLNRDIVTVKNRQSCKDARIYGSRTYMSKAPSAAKAILTKTPHLTHGPRKSHA